ncbi:MAG TPA: exodeoxyribonuclease VII large subunit [Dehalococcoidia bacterium]|nr:exodeoxyribonuclease VII large subunit [Dehalococcoidia bacterium]
MIIYTIRQAASYLRQILEADEVLADLWVEGEVSNLSRPSSGHVYFTLKDDSAQLRCVLFRGQNQGFQLENGAQVIAHGRVSIYEAWGQLQLYVDFVRPQGMGLLHLQLERLKEKLRAEGLFEESRKRPLPAFPRRIGLVTSPTGAVLHDIRTVLGRRWPLVELVLSPTPVQGEEAAPQIVAALYRLYSLCTQRASDLDLIIIARGGGSLEELWPFNDETVARAIFASPVPTISAVGHQTDFTVADMVADLRAPTPSAAAEMAVPDRSEVVRRLGNWREALAGAVRRSLEDRRQDVAATLERAGEALRRLLERQQGELERLGVKLMALNPQGTLARGYAIVEKGPALSGAKGRELVRSVGQIQPGDDLAVYVADGSFAASAQQVMPAVRVGGSHG